MLCSEMAYAEDSTGQILCCDRQRRHSIMPHAEACIWQMQRATGTAYWPSDGTHMQSAAQGMHRPFECSKQLQKWHSLVWDLPSPSC